MRYNYDKLLGLIKEKYGSNKNLSIALGLSQHSLSMKLNNKHEFKQSEISKIAKLLGIPNSKIQLYFFTKEVQ